MNLFLWYPKCSTCRKAFKWLEDNGIEVKARDIRENGPTQEELGRWVEKSGLDIKRFFNTSGNVYKERHLKDKLEGMSREEKLSLLASEPMLVKRPLLVTEDRVLAGFKIQEWEAMIKPEEGAVSGEQE